MSKPNETGDGLTRWLRWTARAIGTLPALGWVSIGVLSFFTEREPWTWESTWMIGLISAVTLATVLAWRRERLGGALLVVSALAFGAFAYVTAGRNKGYAMMVSGGPFLLAGVLFLAVWWRRKRARKNS